MKIQLGTQPLASTVDPDYHNLVSNITLMFSAFFPVIELADKRPLGTQVLKDASDKQWQIPLDSANLIKDMSDNEPARDLTAKINNAVLDLAYSCKNNHPFNVLDNNTLDNDTADNNTADMINQKATSPVMISAPSDYVVKDYEKITLTPKELLPIKITLGSEPSDLLNNKSDGSLLKKSIDAFTRVLPEEHKALNTEPNTDTLKPYSSDNKSYGSILKYVDGSFIKSAPEKHEAQCASGGFTVTTAFLDGFDSKPIDLRPKEPAVDSFPEKNAFVKFPSPKAHEAHNELIQFQPIKPLITKSSTMKPLMKYSNENNLNSVVVTSIDKDHIDKDHMAQDTKSYDTVFNILTDFCNKKLEQQDIFNRINTTYQSSQLNQSSQSSISEGLYTKSEQKPIYPTAQYHNTSDALCLSMGVYCAKLKIHPQDLGEITAEISVHQGVAELKLHADNYSIKHLIETNLNELKDSFQNSNMQLGHISVQNNLLHDKNHSNQQRRSLALFDEMQTKKAQVGPSKTMSYSKSDLIIDTYA